MGPPLVPAPPDLIVRRLASTVWVQGLTVGLASYHFETSACYISYEGEEALSFPALDDGSRPPPRKPFVDVTLDEDALTFEGTIDWSPTTWGGDRRWVYSMAFSSDLLTVMRGQVRAFGDDGHLRRTDDFGDRLRYINADLAATIIRQRDERMPRPMPYERGQNSFERRPGESQLTALARRLSEWLRAEL